MSIPKSFGQRIHEALIEDKVLSAEELQKAVEEHKKIGGGRLIKFLIDNKYVGDEEMVMTIGRCLDVPPVNLSKVHVSEEIMNIIPKQMALNYKLVPIG